MNPCEKCHEVTTTYATNLGGNTFDICAKCRAAITRQASNDGKFAAMMYAHGFDAPINPYMKESPDA